MPERRKDQLARLIVGGIEGFLVTIPLLFEPLPPWVWIVRAAVILVAMVLMWRFDGQIIIIFGMFILGIVTGGAAAVVVDDPMRVLSGLTCGLAAAIILAVGREPFASLER